MFAIIHWLNATIERMYCAYHHIQLYAITAVIRGYWISRLVAQSLSKLICMLWFRVLEHANALIHNWTVWCGFEWVSNACINAIKNWLTHPVRAFECKHRVCTGRYSKLHFAAIVFFSSKKRDACNTYNFSQRPYQMN